MLTFSDILYDIGFSPLPSQTIKIKIELDTNPPAFATYEKKNYSSIAGDYMISTHDLATGLPVNLPPCYFVNIKKDATTTTCSGGTYSKNKKFSSISLT